MATFNKILQVLLGLYMLTGALYMMTNYMDLMSDRAAGFYAPIFWTILAIVQIILSLVLVLGVLKSFGKRTSFSAIGLALISLRGLALYSAYAGFPGMLWGIVPAVLLIAIVYGKKVS